MSIEILLIAAGIITGLIVLRLAIAWFVPIETTSKALLEQELKKYGINPYKVPEKLKSEIVDLSLKITGIKHFSNPKGAAFKADVVRDIQFQAEHLNNFIRHPDWDIFQNQKGDDPFVNMYKRHDLSKL